MAPPPFSTSQMSQAWRRMGSSPGWTRQMEGEAAVELGSREQDPNRGPYALTLGKKPCAPGMGKKSRRPERGQGCRERNRGGQGEDEDAGEGEVTAGEERAALVHRLQLPDAIVSPLLSRVFRGMGIGDREKTRAKGIFEEGAKGSSGVGSYM